MQFTNGKRHKLFADAVWAASGRLKNELAASKAATGTPPLSK